MKTGRNQEFDVLGLRRPVNLLSGIIGKPRQTRYVNARRERLWCSAVDHDGKLIWEAGLPKAKESIASNDLWTGRDTCCETPWCLKLSALSQSVPASEPFSESRTTFSAALHAQVVVARELWSGCGLRWGPATPLRRCIADRFQDASRGVTRQRGSDSYREAENHIGCVRVQNGLGIGRTYRPRYRV